jgi:FkbM family methyltransferase
MPVTSYAQNGEDIRLARALLEPDGPPGFFVDIGACHPVLDSVTHLFSLRGWTGINVEPGEAVFRALAEARPQDINLNVGVSDEAGSLVFHEAVDSLGMSSFNPHFVGGLKRDGYATRARVVEVTTLARICAEHVGDRPIAFLKIDVEGHEREVIAGADWDRHRPRVLLIEATIDPGAWEGTLLRRGYLRAGDDGLNRYYVRDEDAALAPALARPLTVLDDFEPYRHVAEREALHARIAALEAERTAALRAAEEARRQLVPYADLGPRSIALARTVRGLSRLFRRSA